MSESHAVLYLHALSPMHPGSGSALGVIDLPVQRERHTQWPLVPGSSLKGILRDAWRERLYQESDDLDNRAQADQAPWVTRLFGPPTIGNDEGGAHIGALSITDARILAFPVRSLRGVFAWVTCPAVLHRLQRDLNLVGFNDVPECVDVLPEEAYIASDSPLKVDDKVLLEEFEFNAKSHRGLDELFNWLPTQAFADEKTQQQASRQLVILSDDDFTHFVRHATEVQARVRLDYETKTAQKGALFYQEFLPAETLFYSLILADATRDGKSNLDRQAVLSELAEHLPAYLQIGGDATIGKGLCATRLQQGGQN